jgi:hypothetical protein
MRGKLAVPALAILALAFVSCAPTGPSTIEVINLLEARVNDKDLEGVVALFHEDAVWEEPWRDRTQHGIDSIDFVWNEYFYSPVTSEFRDISVDGDTATFTWIEYRGLLTKIWTTNIEVHKGKITRIEWPEDAVRAPAGEE